MKTPLDPRHQKRQTIVQELFAWEAQRSVPGGNASVPGEKLDEKTIEIISLQEAIDTIIHDCAPEWELGKINHTDLAILRLAIYELFFKRSEPTKVVVDEAVELAKEFGTESSPSFINGALGKALTSPLRIKRIISDKLGVDEDKVVTEANLKEDLNATDLEIADLIATLEKELNTQIPQNQRFLTVASILDYFEDQMD